MENISSSELVPSSTLAPHRSPVGGPSASPSASASASWLNVWMSDEYWAQRFISEPWSPWSTMRPRSMKMTCPQRLRNCSWCVTNSTVLPRSSLRMQRSKMCWPTCGSTALSGSSSRYISLKPIPIRPEEDNISRWSNRTLEHWTLKYLTFSVFIFDYLLA